MLDNVNRPEPTQTLPAGSLEAAQWLRGWLVRNVDTSKAAVAGLSDVLRLELAGSAIVVTDVCPGVINTAITTSGSATSPGMTSAQLQRLQNYYAREGCSPDVVANDVLQAVKTGQTLVLSGPYARLTFHLKRLSRRLLQKVMLGSARKLGYL